MKRLLALLMTALCMCSFAQAEELDLSGLKEWVETNPLEELFAEGTLLTTVGEAKTEAVNDIAILSFEISAEGETVAQANQQVTASISTLRDVLIEQGVSEQNIWHKRYDVSPNVVYQNTKLTKGEVIDGYIVDIVFCVRLTDISQVGVVIDTAMQSGAGSTHELVFEKSQAAEAYQSALAQAAQTAMAKAQTLAQSCGMELGELVSVKELSAQTDETARVEVTYRAK